MAIRVEVEVTVPDTRAQVYKKRFESFGLPNIRKVSVLDIYTIDKKLTNPQVTKVLHLLANPITQKATVVVSVRKTKVSGWAIEIGFLPGVTDNIASTAKEEIEDLLGVTFADDEDVYSSQVIIIDAKTTLDEIKKLSQTLANPLIQRIQVEKSVDLLKPIIPKVQLLKKPQVTTVNLAVSDEELIKIGELGIENTDGSRRGPLALSLPYMKAISSYFATEKRKPTDIELESISQTWSEHCKHTIFADPIDDIKNGLYKTYIKGATEKIRQKKGKDDFCVSVFTDNSGAIVFDDEYMVTHKVETHNSPSALDPFGGAITGIVGVNRDAIGFGMGAKPVLNMYGFCLADPDDTKPLFKDKKLSQKMLSPRRILDGVVAGVNAGGNCSGIPTPQGFVYFDKSYKGKPLVFAGTVGILPRKVNKKLMHEKKAMPGDYIVMVGGRVGKDGVHGATFSSSVLDAKSPATAVQIGDPITQKKLSDAIIKEARDLFLYNSITDDGAGGLSCSVAEMAQQTGGCNVGLEKVPLKYHGLEPWEIWISESQERMTLSVPKKHWMQFSKLMEARGVEATVIGEFTDSGKCIVTYNKKTIMDIDMDFLHNGLPKIAQKTLPYVTSHKESNLPDVTIQKALQSMMSRLNLSSTEFIVAQYDHEVQASSVLKPVQGRGRVVADASVSRPVLSSKKGVVLSQALNPTYSEQNSYEMAAATIDTAIRNAVAIGGNIKHMALLDNFCWCSPREEKRLRQLKDAAHACFDIAVSYETPYISGKDSMFNDFSGYDKKGNQVNVSILPTLLISTLGVIPDISKSVSLDFKIPGDLVYLLGETHNELGGSEFSQYVEDTIGKTFHGALPQVDTKTNKQLYEKVFQSIQEGYIASSISVNRGGLGIAIVRAAIGGMLGIDIDLKNLLGSAKTDESLLFSESQGRILVSVAPQNTEKFETLMKGLSFKQIGIVTKAEKIYIKGKNGKSVFEESVENIETQYKKRFKGY